MAARRRAILGIVALVLVACGVAGYLIADSALRTSIENSAGAALADEVSRQLGSPVAASVHIGSGAILPALGLGPVKDVDAELTLTYDGLLHQLQAAGLSQVSAVSGSGDQLKLTGDYEIAGIPVPIEAQVRLVPAGGTVSAELVSVEALGQKVDIATLPGVLRDRIEAWRLPIPPLPDGVTFETIDAGANGVRVDLHADEIDPDTLRSGW